MRKIPLFVVVILVAFSSGSSINTIKKANLDLSFVNAISQNEDAKFVIDKLSLTARIVTAISLQIGLSNGKIPVDNVIAELLSIGSTDLQSLEDFDKTKVEKFLSEMKNLKLERDAVSIEKGFVDIYAIKEAWSTIGDLSKLPDKTTYQKLENIQKLDVSSLTSISLDDPIDNLAKFSFLDSKKVNDLKTTLTAAINKIKATEAMIEYPVIIGILNRLKPFSLIGQVFSLYADVPLLGSDQILKRNKDAVVSDFKNLKKLLSLVDSGSTFAAMNSVISSQFIHHPINRVHTTGFINGFNDLDKLTEDYTDEWLLKMLNPAVNISGVESLIQLKEPMKKLNDEWSEKVSTKEVFDAVKQATEVLELLRTFKAPSDNDFETAMKTVTDCRSMVAITIIPTMKKSASNLDSLIRKILILNAIHTSSKHNQIEAIVEKLSTETRTEDLQKLQEFFGKLKFQLKIVLEGKNIKDTELEIGKSEHITEFASFPSTAGYIKIFNCFKEKAGGYEKVAKAAHIASQIRQIQTDVNMLTNVETASSALSKSSGSLKSIRAVVEKIKKEQNESMELLNEFVSLQNYSKPFGEAVNSMVSASILSEKASEFELFMSSGHSLEAGVKAENNPNLDKEFNPNWGDFGDTVQKITVLRGGVQEWQNGVKASDEGNLTTFAPFFSKLSSLNDVDLQTEKRLAAVDGEVLATKTELKKHGDEFKKSLLELSKLDLQFSRYKSSVMSMPDTLKHVSHVLASASGLKKSTTEEYEDGGGETETWLILGFSTYFIVIFIVFGCHVRLIRKYHKDLKGCVRYIKPKNKKNKKNKKSADVEAGKKKGKKSKSKSKTKKAEKSEVDTLQMSTTSTTSKIG